MNPTEDTSKTSIVIRETVSAMERVHISLSPMSPPEAVLKALNELAGHSVTVACADRAVRYLMAKACLAVKSRKLYRVYTYPNFKAFILAEVVRPGLKWATVMKAVAVVKAWPDERADRLAGVPERNLREAAQIALRGRLNTKQRAKLLDDAERMTVEEFTEAHGREVARKGFAVIRVVTSKSFKREFEHWIGQRDPEEALKELIRPVRQHRRAA